MLLLITIRNHISRVQNVKIVKDLSESQYVVTKGLELIVSGPFIKILLPIENKCERNFVWNTILSKNINLNIEILLNDSIIESQTEKFKNQILLNYLVEDPA